ncbi:MAG TPA: hypothetical protein VG713_13485 [Pirellulales bacterium]|nr:hypothetical protein [Pirellulales bacterium]
MSIAAKFTTQITPEKPPSGSFSREELQRMYEDDLEAGQTVGLILFSVIAAGTALMIASLAACLAL